MVGLSNLTEGRSLTDILINGFGAMNTFQASFADVNVKRSFFHFSYGITFKILDFHLDV